MRTFKDVEDIMVSKGYKFFRGEISVNSIFERTSDIFTDTFDDYWHILFRKNRQDTIITVPCTTNAGSFYVKNPITAMGITGTLSIIPNQYISVDEFIDTEEALKSYKFPFNYAFFMQRGLLQGWRDGNKDDIIDHVNIQSSAYFGANVHIMSQINSTSPTIYNWSAACFGAIEPEFKKMLPVVRESVRIYGKMFSRTLLEAKDFS